MLNVGQAGPVEVQLATFVQWKTSPSCAAVHIGRHNLWSTSVACRHARLAESSEGEAVPADQNSVGRLCNSSI